MADQPTDVDAPAECRTCGGLRRVARRYDSGQRYTRGARIRAAALVPCPDCVPKQLEERKPDA